MSNLNAAIPGRARVEQNGHCGGAQCRLAMPREWPQSEIVYAGLSATNIASLCSQRWRSLPRTTETAGCGRWYRPRCGAARPPGFPGACPAPSRMSAQRAATSPLPWRPEGPTGTTRRDSPQVPHIRRLDSIVDSLPVRVGRIPANQNIRESQCPSAFQHAAAFRENGILVGCVKEGFLTPDHVESASW